MGSLPTGTKEQKALHRKWGRAIDVALNKVRAVVAAPAQTLEGMLMKIHADRDCGLLVLLVGTEKARTRSNGMTMSETTRGFGEASVIEPSAAPNHAASDSVAGIVTITASVLFGRWQPDLAPPSPSYSPEGA